MKVLMLTLCLIAGALPVLSQKLLQQIADDVCDCMEERGSEMIGSGQNEFVETCVEPLLDKYKSKLEKEYGDQINSEDDEFATQLGMDVGKLLLQCPAFIAYFVEAQEDENKSVATYEKLAKEAKEQGDYEKVLDYYTKAIAITQENDEFFNERGIARFHLGEYYHAISDFFRAIELNEDNSNYHYNIAYSLYHLDDNQEALKYVESTLSKSEKNCKAYNLKGLIHYDLQDMDLGLLNFKLGFECDSIKDPVKAYNIAYTYYTQAEYEPALQWFYQADSLKYPNEGVYSYIGNTYYSLENYEKAIEMHEKHLSYDSTNYIPWYNLGTCYFDQDKMNEAVFYFKKAFQYQKEDAELVYYLARTYLNLDDYEQAKQFVEKGLELDDGEPGFYDVRGEIYYHVASYDKAIRDYMTSIEIYPDDCKVYNLLGEAYEKNGESSKAQASFDKAKEKGCD